MCQGYSPNSVLLSRSVPKNSYVSLVNIVHIYKNSYLSLRTQSHFHSICLQVQPFTRRTISELLIATYKKNNLRASPTVQPLIRKKISTLLQLDSHLQEKQSQSFSNCIPTVQPLTRKIISKLLNNIRAFRNVQPSTRRTISKSFSNCTAIYNKSYLSLSFSNCKPIQQKSYRLLNF